MRCAECVSVCIARDTMGARPEVRVERYAEVWCTVRPMREGWCGVLHAALAAPNEHDPLSATTGM